MLFLGLGQPPRELIEITGADQLAPGGMAAWRHGPVLTGDAAIPDRPPRILAPQLLEPGVLAGAAPVGVHAENRRAGNVMPDPDVQDIN